MLPKTISKKYATALFKVAQEDKNIEVVMDNLNFIKNILTSDIMKIIANPNVSHEEKKLIINKLFGSRVCHSVKNFLNILIDKKRIVYFLDIYNAFVNIHLEQNSIVAGEVISPMNLEDSQKIKIKNTLEKKYKKTFILNFKINKDLIGGILIKIGNEIIDGSLRNQLIKVQNILLS
ncbi:MAG: ATP synthase F1 subunit delta [Candidatus Firestonebacteria bacterium]